MPEPIHLNGLDGANPLGFLAAIGTLALASRQWPDAAMSWRPHANSYRPTLHGTCDGGEALASALHDGLTAELADEVPSWAEPPSIKGWSADAFRRLMAHAVHSAEDDPRPARLVAGFASDAVAKDAKAPDGPRRETSLSHANGQGEQHLLKFYKEMVADLTTDDVEASLFRAWRYARGNPRFRWDPADGRNFPVAVGSANTESAGVELGANVLAFSAFEMLPSFPAASDDLHTAAFARLPVGDGRSGMTFTWPLWETAASTDVVRSLLNDQRFVESEPPRSQMRAMSILAVLRCPRLIGQKNLFFGETTSV